MVSAALLRAPFWKPVGEHRPLYLCVSYAESRSGFLFSFATSFLVPCFGQSRIVTCTACWGWNYGYNGRCKTIKTGVKHWHFFPLDKKYTQRNEMSTTEEFCIMYEAESLAVLHKINLGGECVYTKALSLKKYRAC